MTTPVIAGIDGSRPGRRAAEYAAATATRRGAGLELVHAFTWPLIYPPLLPEEEQAPYPLPRMRARKLLDDAATAVAADHPNLRIDTTLVDGHAAGALVDASRRGRLLVVGHRGIGGFEEMLVGSVGVYTSVHAHCPVVVVRGTTPADGAPVVVGVDGSPAARAAARVAFDEARLRGVDLIAALAWPPARTWPQAEAAAGVPAHPHEVDPIAVTLAGIVEEYPDVKVRTEVLHGDSAPATLIALASELGAGLLVAGSRGVGGFRGLLMGGTCRALIDHAPCPVLVLPKGVLPG